MKYLWYLLAVLTISCKSSIEIAEPISKQIETCPENGICSIELIPNKSLEFKTDNLGILYPVISEGDHVILKYTFNKKTKKELQDGSYTEIIYADLGEKITHMNLENEDLYSINLHFGRLCYCKGETGYFPVKKGRIKISKCNNKQLKIALNFGVSEVPQVISIIDETISLKSN